MSIRLADEQRWKYKRSHWTPVCKSKKGDNLVEYKHPDSPNSGKFWMDKAISFKNVKLTNNNKTKTSMEKASSFLGNGLSFIFLLSIFIIFLNFFWVSIYFKEGREEAVVFGAS